MDIVHLTNENFAEEINTDQKVLIDFWASWCGPCKMVSPILDEIASEDHDFKICKVNVDEQPDLAQQFMVRSIPTLVVMKNGQAAATTVGAQPKANIIKFVEEA
ncbi:MAG: thioredoxin [Firmicutes bacterium]|nr:thioredoxin [Bacillota bacterium]